jgi:penicillin-binding protein 1A
MEKVYKDKSLGITQGPFPKPGVKITREYQCETPRYASDTTSIDSLLTDSLYIPDEVSDTIERSNFNARQTISPKIQENKSNLPTDNKAPVNPKTEPPVEVQKMRKEIRDDRKQNKPTPVN